MAFVKPESLIGYFELRPGMQAADFGTGTGEYAVSMAQAVIPNGKVYAVDVQKDLLLRLKDMLAKNHITNVSLLWGDLEEYGGSKIGDSLLDFVLVSNLLSQVQMGYQLAREAKRVLRPGGKLAVIDWSESFGHMGPHPEAVVSAQAAKNIFMEAGFRFVRDFPAGDHHYGLIFEKP